MTTHPVYDQLLSEITDELEHKVLSVLIDHAGEHVTRPDLVFQVFGISIEKNKLASCTEDRKIRECIENLQKKDYPIVASSGEPGYVLAADDETTDAYIAELVSRQVNLDEKVSAVRRSKRWIPFIRQWQSSRPAIQKRLF